MRITSLIRNSSDINRQLDWDQWRSRRDDQDPGLGHDASSSRDNKTTSTADLKKNKNPTTLVWDSLGISTQCCFRKRNEFTQILSDVQREHQNICRRGFYRLQFGIFVARFGFESPVADYSGCVSAVTRLHYGFLHKVYVFIKDRITNRDSLSSDSSSVRER